MTLILGIDTATAVAVGLADGERVLASRQLGGMQHVERLVPLVQELLAAEGRSLAELTGVAVGLGPGPFTGLRVGIVAAHVLAATRGLPIKGLCSLDAIAAAAGDAAPSFVAASDARRKELYWATYTGGVRVDGPHVSSPDDLPDLPVVGPGAVLYADRLGERARLEVAEPVDAGVLALLSVSAEDLGLEPLYLRKPDAQEPSGRKSALTGVHEQANR